MSAVLTSHEHHLQSLLSRLGAFAVDFFTGSFVFLLALYLANTPLLAVTMKKVEYKGWKNNLQLSNGTVELVVTLDVGPRILRYGFVGGPNVFLEAADQMGKAGEATWQSRGGHRLWHAPEDLVRTYALDNSPVRFEKISETTARIVQPVESITGVQKELDITLEPEGTRVTVVHRLRNTGLWEIELAPWALSVLAPGGAAIIPLPGKTPHPQGLLPNQRMILWPYTDLSDSRYRFGGRYIVLKQDSGKGPTKIGLAHKLGWAGYLRDGLLFVKGYSYADDLAYPDFGCNLETFTNMEMLELESLGPLGPIKPGKAVEHTERWWLIKDLPSDTSDAAIDAAILPAVERVMKN